MSNMTDMADQEQVYRVRRREMLIAVVTALLLGQVMGANILGFFKDRAITGMNTVFEAFPDEAFGILIDRGDVSPAPHSEIFAWVELARQNGNTEPTGELEYVLGSAYVYEDGISLPNGMTGAHSRVFLVRRGHSLPGNARDGHNTYMYAETGTCLGTMPGCAFF